MARCRIILPGDYRLVSGCDATSGVLTAAGAEGVGEAVAEDREGDPG